MSDNTLPPMRLGSTKTTQHHMRGVKVTGKNSTVQVLDTSQQAGRWHQLMGGRSHTTPCPAGTASVNTGESNPPSGGCEQSFYWLHSFGSKLRAEVYRLLHRGEDFRELCTT
mmetsp:Transcript_875/g.1994  ORF Transcript_875/g.1994 Transcript_875/m.1994 type:complete len:112 (-) Transcript_875:98-433(-)